MFQTVESASDRVNIMNLGTDEYVEVNDSVDVITTHLGLTPERSYSGGERGWIGDNPFIFLDCSRVRSLGWSPQYSIREGILKTLQWLEKNHWVLRTEE